MRENSSGEYRTFLEIKQSASFGGLFTNGSNDRLYEKRTYFSKRDRYCPYPSSSSFSTGMNRMAAEFMQ